MKTQILVESVSAMEGNIITESVNDGKNVFLKGIFMQAEIKNRNGRVYPLSEMTSAIGKMNDNIRQYGGVFGELDHPAGLTINMDRISHVITECYMDGNNAIGKAKLLDTPMGKIAKELANSGVRYGVSSRGTGNVNESDGMVSGFNVVTIDLVATPSAHNAYPQSVMESLEQLKTGQKVLTLAETIQYDKSAQKFFSKAIKDFLEELTKK
jgi:hypothetical protein